MLPDRGSNPGPLTCESGALPIALRGPADVSVLEIHVIIIAIYCNNIDSWPALKELCIALLFYVHGKHSN